MDKNQNDSQKMDAIFGEVDKYLKEKEEFIKESVIGSRILNELEDFNLDVGLKKTYLCINKEQENVFDILTKVTEHFIQAYGGTTIIYPKGDNICLELITPKRGV
ncbi:MAG: hypothetical protein Q7U35_10155 [Methanobacteriaceae archaeon]|nr:hypothetical protein [Methanobacteriaceae archaeon]MDP2835427.1 hypothetical protein [Methanobacteriaceae archaeon]MDP3033598.1 hypothetical protein [Methanobacteriaceae archaeon]MDP3486238.1 hypothetical protein [Methanobacteriaceae archaeon]